MENIISQNSKALGLLPSILPAQSVSLTIKQVINIKEGPY